MRARPEPTQLEHLTDASLMGKLLVLPEILRLDWKVIAGTNTLAYLTSLTVMMETSFYNIDTWQTGIKNGKKKFEIQSPDDIYKHLCHGQTLADRTRPWPSFQL